MRMSILQLLPLRGIEAAKACVAAFARHAALVALHAIMAGQILRMASGPLTTVRVRSGTAGRGCFICRRACGAREDHEGHDRALMILVSRVADLTCDIKEWNASVVESTAAICNRTGNKDLESFSW